MDELALPTEPRIKIALSSFRGFTLIVNFSLLPIFFFFFLTSVSRAVINFTLRKRETVEASREEIASCFGQSYCISCFFLVFHSLLPALSADNKSLWNLINLTLGTV